MGACAASEQHSESSPRGHAFGPQSEKVLDLVNSDEWQSLPITAAGLKRKLHLIVEKADSPHMKCIAASTLTDLGRIPIYAEGYAVNATEVCDNHGVLVFVSHKWLRAQEGLPDDANNTKAKLLIEWADWYHSRYPPRTVYFWIDWCCVDQALTLALTLTLSLALILGTVRCCVVLDHCAHRLPTHEACTRLRHVQTAHVNPSACTRVLGTRAWWAAGSPAS